MHRYHVLANDWLSPSVFSLIVQEFSQSQPFSYLAGQYASLNIVRSLRSSPSRCFSIVSSPLEPGRLQFVMRLNGAFTHAAQGLQVGDRVNISGPHGAFVLDPNHSGGVVMLAGGIGITPMMSMLRYAARLDLPIPITLLYSCRALADAVFAAELIELENTYRYLRVAFVISQDDQGLAIPGARTRAGRISPALLHAAARGDYANTKFMICGPDSFMKAMQTHLAQLGTPAGNVITEAFVGRQHEPGGRPWLGLLPDPLGALAAASVILGAGAFMSADLWSVASSAIHAEATASPSK